MASASIKEQLHHCPSSRLSESLTCVEHGLSCPACTDQGGWREVITIGDLMPGEKLVDRDPGAMRE